MSGLTAVLRHEIAERRLLLLVSPLLGLLALAAPLWSAAGTGAASSELRDTAALFLALALSGLGALLLGASAIGADLASRRLAFFFSRPLSGAAVWAGKLGAAAICAWTAGLLVLLPVLLVDAAAGSGAAPLLHNPVLPGSVVGLWFAALPLAVLIAHVLGVILRTRSAWLILDLAGTVTVWTIALATIRRLQYWGALADPLPLVPLCAIAGAAAGAVLLVASAAEVIDGRTDAVRGHRTLSLTLAGLGLAGALAFAAVAQHWIAITPQDLDRWSFAAVAPGQQWIALSGPAPGPSRYGASFLLQAGSGRSVRTRFAEGPEGTLPLAFSADGRRAVWVEHQDGQRTSPEMLVRLDLDRDDAEPVRTPIVESTPADHLAISSRGHRVAVIRDQGLSVYELDSGRLLAAHTFAGSMAWPYSSVFMSENRVRVLISRYQAQNRPLAYDLDLASRHLTGLGTLPNCSWQRYLSPDARRVACNGAPSHEVAVFDLASGRQLAELRQPGAKVRASYLADGRLAMQIAGPSGTELTLLDGDGRQQPGAPRFRLPPGTAFGWFRMPTGAPFGWIVQAGVDRVLVREIPADRRRLSQGLWTLLDLRQGATRSLGPHGLQLLPPFASPPAASAPLFTDGTRLLRIDLATGERHALGPARPYHNALLDPW